MVGDVTNSRECEEGYAFEIKEVSSAAAHTTVTADENGQAWLLLVPVLDSKEKPIFIIPTARQSPAGKKH